jgi:hypothetical protein
MADDQLHPIQMLVLDRGFVLVGRCPDPEGFAFWLPVTDCRVVRRWGTTNGLCELVNGPLSDTVLDAMSLRERVPVRAILRVIDVSQEAWAGHLKAASAGSTRQPEPRSSRTGSRS